MGQIMHVNSVSYDASRDQILLSSAMHSELWIIDHATTTAEAAGERGDLLYRSELLELSLPVDDAGNWTWDLDDPLNGATITWSFNADGTAGLFSPFMSGARRCANGNTAMAQGYDKRIREVTPDGELVLDFTPGGVGRTFRVIPIAADHPGLARLGVATAGSG